ncbi:MAG: hypothetical protein LBU77_02230 [Clostridiales bacterium]|jgi:regulatory protein YycH of two-component signal transduction system YycFG|nr:hypothetical protein [Clostridiales bacterium]
MKTGRIQNVIIFSLVVLTFFQTGELWFGGTPNHNFFYSFFSAGANGSDMASLPDLTKPYRIAASVEQGRYKIKYSGISASEQKKTLDDAVTTLFAKGTYVGQSAMDWSVLSKSLLFEYHCAVPTDAFSAAYRQKAGLLTTRFAAFDRILLVPGNTAYEPASVLFHDAAADQCHTFRIDQSDLNQTIKAAREKLSVADNRLYYTASSSLSALPVNLFSKHVFVPMWDDAALSYADIEKINPYADGGFVLSYTVGDNINMFFNNPGRKQYTLINDVLTFSDETTVVKYHQSNILECNNYRTADTDKPTTFATAFNQAVEFIKLDTTIGAENEYYLADYYEDTGEWHLFFDFTVNDFPVFLSNRAGSTPELTHAIEITVSDGIVTKYMRSAYLYKTREQSTAVAVATEKGIDALNTAIDNYLVPEEEDGAADFPPELIQSIELGYNSDSADTVSLCWHIGYTETTRKSTFPATSPES